MRFLLLLVKLSILAVATVYAQDPELVRHFALAQAGVVSLLTDGPVARPGYVTDDTLLNEKEAAHSVQQVVDFRRGVDLLLARKDVDPNRLAFVGHSYTGHLKLKPLPGKVIKSIPDLYQPPRPNQ